MFSGIAKWCELMDLQFIGRTSFYRYQRQLVIPQIQRHCQLSLQQARQEIIERGKGRRSNKNIYVVKSSNEY